MVCVEAMARAQCVRGPDHSCQGGVLFLLEYVCMCATCVRANNTAQCARGPVAAVRGRGRCISLEYVYAVCVCEPYYVRPVPYKVFI